MPSMKYWLREAPIESYMHYKKSGKKKRYGRIWTPVSIIMGSKQKD